MCVIPWHNGYIIIVTRTFLTCTFSTVSKVVLSVCTICKFNYSGCEPLHEPRPLINTLAPWYTGNLIPVWLGSNCQVLRWASIMSKKLDSTAVSSTT